ncbi:MAG: tRNA lysidine(34) synthetase TilS [Lachnospiraceae bacterium]|nr:tRNA lysidine(34) synthetase TilS [Lachnospiraceae bacterium]
MKTKVFEYITKYEMLREGDRVVIGVSGGPDSVCLLFLLHEFARTMKLDIEAVHVNHMLREEADDEEKFVSDLCAKLGIRFHAARADVKKYAEETGLSTEEAGRIIRYDAFKKVLGLNEGRIAVAHNKNDLAETVMFNLFRGSGLKGLCGIEPVNGQIIRPLLCCQRSEIMDYLEKNGIEYVIDKSNLTDEYTRNKIRHHIIEYAEENIVHGCVSNIARATERLSCAESYIKKMTLEAATRCAFTEGPEILLYADKLKEEDPFIAENIIYEMIATAAGAKKDITSEHVANVYDLLYTDGTKEIDLPYGITVRKEYNRVSFLRNKDRDEAPELPPVTQRILEDFDPENIPRDNYTKWFDYDKISNACVLRYRAGGDYLTVNASCGKKSLQDYMVNEKIPKDKRDSIPILADGSHVMWVVGYRISEYYKVTADTKRVLEVTVCPSNDR